MKTIPLQSEIVYGPIDSRRFGKSLGINLLPANSKVCSFDCVYCQYKEGSGGHGFPSFPDIYTQLLQDFERIRDQKIKLDWIMLSGNGEPTLHPEFPDIVDGLLTLRELYFPEISLGILSNSSTCYRPDVREALQKLDGRFMKLDAGDEHLFLSLNQPWNKEAWAQTIKGLSDLRRIVIQSMFVGGRVDNTGEEAVKEWVRIVKYINPEAVQIYTLDRLPAHEDVLPVSNEKLKKIASYVEKYTHIQALVYD